MGEVNASWLALLEWALAFSLSSPFLMDKD